MKRWAAIALAGALFGCDAGASSVDAATAMDARSPSLPDAGPVDARVAADGAAPRDATTLGDGGGGDASLSALRDALFATSTDTPCATWSSFDESQRAVFLTLTHRLYTSRTPDGRPMLAHVDGLHRVLGGGADGTECGGIDNNRLFLSMDDYLWARMVETWDDARVIEDGAGSHWLHTGDAAGPHDPFDASSETDTGLRCTLLIETSESRPPTAQAHFFLAGSAVPVERGPGPAMPTDPHMLEIDHDFDCIHRSNPTCRDFVDRYRDNHGDYECAWVPSACVPVGTGCHRAATDP